MATSLEAPREPGGLSLAPAGEVRRLMALGAEQLGVAVDRVEALPAGLGLRRFYRIHLRGAPASVIARVESEEDPAGRPPGVAAEPPLEPIRGLLERQGLPVPRRLGSDSEHGIELLEDAGERFLESAPDREARVSEALDLVPRIQSIADPGGVAAFRRHLDAPLFGYKATLFARHSLPEALGREATPAEAEAVAEAFAWIAERCAEAPQRLAHRDFQSRNLLVVPRRADGGRLVMIDLQGAFLAPPEYDLVCLLRDSYLSLDDAWVDAERRRILPRLPDLPAEEPSARRFDWLTLTRKGKDHARFLYVLRERGDTRVASALPTTTAYLKQAARRSAGDAPALRRLAELVEALPEEAPCAG